MASGKEKNDDKTAKSLSPAGRRPKPALLSVLGERCGPCALQTPWFPHHLLSSAAAHFISALSERRGRQEGSQIGKPITKLLFGSCEWSDVNIQEHLQPLPAAAERCLSKNRL